MTKITIVTSMSGEGYKEYGKRFLDSFNKYCTDKHNISLVVYGHDFEEPRPRGVSVRLEDYLEYVAFKKTYAQYTGEGTPNGQGWRYNVLKWCNKVFAMYYMAQETRNGYLIWLDADTEFTSEFTSKDLLPPNVIDEDSQNWIWYLDREGADYPETSYICVDMEDPKARGWSFFRSLYETYMSGTFKMYREWHDGFIIGALLALLRGRVNLTPNVPDLDAFHRSHLKGFMRHYKGNFKGPKGSGVSPDVNASRYSNLSKLIQYYGCKYILETGTWNGGRAIQMISAVVAHTNDRPYYVGFDLFEDATAETDSYEMNTKPHNTIEAVTNRLNKWKDETGNAFDFELFKGDTNKTLKAYINAGGESKPIDFIYIDGGHSYATVKNDFDTCRKYWPNAIIVLDDYFGEDEKGKKPPEEHCGVNKLVEELKEAGELGTIIPSMDRVAGGGITNQVIVLPNKDTPPPPEEMIMTPIIVEAKDSVDDQVIIDNINTNLEAIEDYDWLERGAITSERMILVSGGTINFERLKDVIFKYPKAPVVCVKHSLPKLLDVGIVPDYCVVLDPRPVDGVSTHGVKRRDLFARAGDIDTIFLVASMTEPSVVNHLKELGATIKGFHAYSNALRDMSKPNEFVQKEGLNLPEGTTLVTGGTCSATRAMGLFHILGFRFFHFFGFDCCVPEPEDVESIPKKEGKPTIFSVKHKGSDVTYWTTGELVALAQDLERMLRLPNIEFDIQMHCEGTLAQAVFNAWKEEIQPPYAEKILERIN